MHGDVHAIFSSATFQALTKFLKCVNWDLPQEAKQALELLGKWRPMDVEDSLELLSSQFTNPTVRRYAVARLQQADDEVGGKRFGRDRQHLRSGHIWTTRGCNLARTSVLPGMIVPGRIESQPPWTRSGHPCSVSPPVLLIPAPVFPQDLLMYLLQLVQALKYENFSDIQGGLEPGSR